MLIICVAPHAGARIETNRLITGRAAVKSLPTQERELKPWQMSAHIGEDRSLPTRERELKL